LCKNYVALVLKSSIEKRVGRTLSRVGKSNVGTIKPAMNRMHDAKGREKSQQTLKQRTH